LGRFLLSSGVLVWLIAQPAFGVTYYVDAASGNDAWSGRQSTPAGTNGPWRSLGRIATAPLLPGDVVFLKCGAVWNESLRVTASGSAAAPITIGRYPAGCSNKPIIDGAAIVPANAWRHYAGGIYRVTLPVNLIRNAEFDEGTSYWSSWSEAGTQSIASDTTCGTGSTQCLRFTSATGDSIATSSSFSVNGTNSMAIRFRMQAPAGVQVRVSLRRSSAPWDSIGFSTLIDGTGTWHSYSFNASVSSSAGVAHLAFQIPGGAKVVRIDNVRVTGPALSPRRLYAGTRMLLPAHHPNRGHDPRHPQSIFARIAADSDRTSIAGKTVSTYLTTGDDLDLAPNQVLTPGLGITMRTNDWMIDELKIGSVSGNRIYMNAPSTHPLRKDWGYYLTGALWMLDRPGEWFYDASTGNLFAWMFGDVAPPDTRVAHRIVGVDIAGESYVTLEGLHVRSFETGIRMQRTLGARVRNSTITDSGQNGIDAHASIAATIEWNAITNSGRDAISGFEATGGPAADRMTVRGNAIVNSGVRDGAAGNALPVRTYAAVRAGTNALVTANEVRNSAFIAIWTANNSTVEKNFVIKPCLVMNDCGSIYVARQNTAMARIFNNIVMDPVGNLDGAPRDHFTMAQGIYLDDLSSNVQVVGNTVVRADNGVHVHNGSANVIQGNSLYANRRFQLWMQEDSATVRANGDIWNNNVAHNLMFPTSANSSVRHETSRIDTSDFSAYSGNRYSTLLSPRIVDESWAGGSAAYTLTEWQAARKADGSLRNLDAGASQISGAGYTVFRVAGSNLVPNGSFTAGGTGWTTWNASAPHGVGRLEPCPQGACLHYLAGSTISLLSSPNFSLVKDRWYRVSFDAKVAIQGQGITAAIRRGGGGDNGYEPLATSPAVFTGSTAWKRYAFIFKATESVNANDPATRDLGARIDFERIPPGSSITVGNVQLYPLGESTMQTRILVNPTAATRSMDCPDREHDPDLCARFARFSDGGPVYWPQLVGAHGSEIIFSRDPTLVDHDGDGIADSQDACPGTAAGAMTNARGCSYEQSPAG